MCISMSYLWPSSVAFWCHISAVNSFEERHALFVQYQQHPRMHMCISALTNIKWLYGKHFQARTSSCLNLVLFSLFVVSSQGPRSVLHSSSISLSFSVHLTPWHSFSHTCTHARQLRHPEESLSITLSGSQVNLPDCQMCRIGVLPGVKSLHYGPKAKPRKWMQLSPFIISSPPWPPNLLVLSLHPYDSIPPTGL